VDLNRPHSILILALLLAIPAIASGSPVLSNTSPGTATYDQALSHYDAGGQAWSRAWGASGVDQIRQHLDQSKASYTACFNTSGAVNDPSNAANLALMRSISTAYIDLADAALAMYDGGDDYAAGRTRMAAGDFSLAAPLFERAGTRFETSKTLFSKGTTTLQAVTYAGTTFGDGTAYTAAIVPILDAKGDYMGEFTTCARGWQHTALAYGAGAGGDRATLSAEAALAMYAFDELRTSPGFGSDAAMNYEILAALIPSGQPVSITEPTADLTVASTPSPPREENAQAPTRTTLTSSHAQQVPGASVTVTALVERYDDATGTWTPAPDTDVMLMQSRIAEQQPSLTGGWVTLGTYRTSAAGTVTRQAQVSSVGYNGFKAWKTTTVDDPLAASMSSVAWVETRHVTHWFDRPYQPYDEARLVFLIGWAQVVSGKILDENNNPVPNQGVDVFVWSTKEVVSTVYTDKYGVFSWGRDHFFIDDRPPEMGVRYAGDFNYRGLPDQKCYVETIYPDPPS